MIDPCGTPLITDAVGERLSFNFTYGPLFVK